MIVGVSGAFRLLHVIDSIVATLLVIHLFDLIISCVQTSSTNAHITSVVLRSENGALLVTSICEFLGLT